MKNVDDAIAWLDARRNGAGSAQRPTRRTPPRLYTWNGTTLTTQEWAQRLGISVTGFKSRVSRHGPDSPRTFLRRAKARPRKTPRAGQTFSAAEVKAALSLLREVYAGRVVSPGLRRNPEVQAVYQKFVRMSERVGGES